MILMMVLIHVLLVLLRRDFMHPARIHSGNKIFVQYLLEGMLRAHFKMTVTCFSLYVNLPTGAAAARTRNYDLCA